jgi:hypothetical protein
VEKSQVAAAFERIEFLSDPRPKRAKKEQMKNFDGFSVGQHGQLALPLINTNVDYK